MSNRLRNVEVFNRDVEQHAGYVYTTSTRISTRLATQRTTDIILETGLLEGSSVLDMGCGDGFYTLRFWDRGRPRAMVGVDGASGAIAVAEANKGTRPITFAVGDAHHLAYEPDSFDVVLVQSILHHDDDPRDMIREAFRLAPTVIIHEPNGNNIGLKAIEKLSSYHREHAEKSYSSRQLGNWVAGAGGRVTDLRFAGFVPMFSPDWLARAMKAVEPIVERVPAVNALACAVYVMVATRIR
ncbi:MAG: class I SAM-dependent methyltransferase [Gemmatimonadaceae bacterium]